MGIRAQVMPSVGLLLGVSILSSCWGSRCRSVFVLCCFTPLSRNQTGSSFSFTGVLFHTTLTRGALLVAAVSDSNGSEDVPFKEPFGSSRHVTNPPRARALRGLVPAFLEYICSSENLAVTERGSLTFCGKGVRASHLTTRSMFICQALACPRCWHTLSKSVADSSTRDCASRVIWRISDSLFQVASA